MTVTFLLNWKEVTADTPPDRRLVDLLRENFFIPGCRASCNSGECGTCAVFFNGELAYSCLIPVFAANGADVLTYEGLADTEEMKGIEAAFEEAGCFPCLNCRQSKLLTAYSLLETHPVPDRKEIESAFEGQMCRCTDMPSIRAAVNAAVTLRRSRRHAGR